jgi:hypothetical protein
MKKYINLLSISFFLLSSPVPQLFAADEPVVEKRKTYSKSYDISGNDRISLNNQFGEVRVSTWTKNEVKVDVTIITNAATDERAQQLLDLVSIEDGKNSNGVFFKTNRKNDVKKTGDKKDYKNENSKTNYQVYLPAGNPLSVTNQFGATILPDLNGLLEVESKFGSLTAGKLNNVKQLSVEFGSARIESMKGNQLSVKFSRAIIDNIEGNITASFQHCSGVKLGVENALKGLTINNNFTNLYLDVNRNLSADVAISTNFGNFKNSTAFNIQEAASGNGKKRGKFTTSYSGKAGGGGASIRISSEFGNVVMGHDLTMDLKEDKKTKEEKKTKMDKKTTTRI